MASIQMSFAIMPAAVYWFAGESLASGSHAISIGTVVAFTTLQTRMLFPIQSLLSVGVEVQTSLALFGRIFEYLDLPVDIVERPRARPLADVRGEVRLDDVWFRYAPDSPWTLREIDAEIPAGTQTALVGETGSGKTTLAYLVARLYEPERGCVSIDGVDIRDMTLESLRRNIGVVFQEPMLFARSIEENLRVGKPEATPEEIAMALERAQAADFVSRNPEGVSALVGERGRSLSGGERQRLSIARALLKDPPIMIFDEATSALDATTEGQIQAALERATHGRTTFVIAHRLATIRNAKCILVFEHGRIVERGTFEQLLARDGKFAALARAQYMTSEADDSASSRAG
jgi:ATP-binding cassette, subfamily B, bacterial